MPEHEHRHGHGHGHKFDPERIERLRDPERLTYMNPDRIWAELATGPIDALVDLGAGIGFFAIPFARHMPSGVVYACDIENTLLAHLEEALEPEDVGNVRTVQTEEVHVPLDDEVADVVFMANLHHEFDHPLDSLAESRRLLRPGGRIAVIDWKPEETPQGPPVEVRIAPATVRAQLEQVGFREVTDHPVLPYHYFLTATK